MEVYQVLCPSDRKANTNANYSLITIMHLNIPQLLDIFPHQYIWSSLTCYNLVLKCPPRS